MGNGEEWLDVDASASRRATTPVAFAVGILTGLAVATGIWLYCR